jgi:hypothetical protein
MFTHFPAEDYHLRALQQRNFNVTTRRTTMAKGQQRKTKEAKKPKKQPVPAKP